MSGIDDYYNAFFTENYHKQSQHYEREYRRLRDEYHRLRLQHDELLARLKNEDRRRYLLSLLYSG